MKIFCTASKDTYIANKIINNRLVADDANVGRAGTLDLFRLYNETTLRGTGSQDELSRLLIKFDLKPIKNLTASIVDLNSSNFSAKLKLFDVRSGHAVPSNFKVITFPLSKSFDEGVGRDISSFGDVDAANFITSSYSEGTANIWHISGANKSGLLGSEDIDIISSGNLSDGNGVVNLWKTQTFEVGTEDLSVDVTSIVSATLAGLIPDEGFRLSFSGTQETDKKSRFVKRFASRHVANPHIRPRIEVSFDDSVQDNHGNFLFDVSGSLFLQNYVRSSKENIVSGSTLSEVTGSDCMKLKLKKGTFEFVVDASQHTQGTGDNQAKGLYSASFAIPSNTDSLYNKTKKLSQLISEEKEVIFDEYWYSTDGTVGFHTGSVKIKSPERKSNEFALSDPDIWSLNLNSEYTVDDTERVRLYCVDHIKENNKPTKKRIKRESDIFDEVYYRIIDRDSRKIIFDFGEDDNSTRVSTDSSGMFFDVKFSLLPRGRTYQFQFLINHRGTKLIVDDPNANFRIR